MNIGMLWFDNDPKAELAVKVERAAAYYRNKYGRAPTICFVHPSMLGATPPPPSETGGLKAGGLEIHPTRNVLPNHLWLGVNSANPA